MTGEGEGARDLAVREAAREEAQDLALGERAGGAERAAQDALGQGRLEHRAARGQGADGLQELLESDVLQQVAARAGADRVEQEVGVVEGGQDMPRARRGGLAAAQDGEASTRNFLRSTSTR